MTKNHTPQDIIRDLRTWDGDEDVPRGPDGLLSDAAHLIERLQAENARLKSYIVMVESRLNRETLKEVRAEWRKAGGDSPPEPKLTEAQRIPKLCDAPGCCVSTFNKYCARHEPLDREQVNALALECAQASAVVRKCPVCGTTNGHHGFGCPV